MKILLIKNTTSSGKANKKGVSKTTSTSSEYNITKIVSAFTWSGSDSQASRTFDFSVINAPYDTGMKEQVPEIAVGDVVKWYDDEKRLRFYGMVYDREATSASGTERFTARDLMYHLTRSTWTKSFKKTTAEKIAQAACKEAGIKAGAIAKTGIAIKSLIVESTSLYDTIMLGYQKASKTTKWKYKAFVDGTKLSVISKGAVVDQIDLSDKTNITSANISESISDIVNKVRAYSDKNKLLGTVQQDKSVGKYGIFQKTYKKEDGITWKKGAAAQYVDASQNLTVTALGSLSCVSGYAVKVKDGATGMKATYWITEDSHTFENGVHTMQLTLSCTNEMQVDADESKNSSKPKVKDSATCYYLDNSSVYHSAKTCSACKGKKTKKSTVGQLKKIKIKSGKNKGKAKYSACAKCWQK